MICKQRPQPRTGDDTISRESAKGVVAAGHELTVRAAETILRKGGNAFDAILAAHFAACVAEPVLASLGGGGFLIASSRGSEPVLYDFFVQTPRHKRNVDDRSFRPVLADFGTTQQEFHIGHGTIATPGSVKGVFRIHRDLATMPLSQIAAPAVRYARDGIELNGLQAHILSIVSPIYSATPEAREIFCDPARNGVLGEGDTIAQPQLADTIEQLVVEGEDLFYRGRIGRDIVAHCRDGGGHLTREDLESYEVVKRKPLDVQYGGAHLMTNPPPSSGGILIALALELLKESNPTGYVFGSYPYLRLLAEVMTLTNEARIDAIANERDGEGYRHLLDPEYLDRYRKEIAHRAKAIRGTTQLSVIDSQGNIASMTVSNGEGCGSIVPNTGIMANNMLGEQDLNVRGFHRWGENQRMTSMMAPSLIRKSNGAMVATGSGGSNRIRTALLQVIMNLIHFDMDVKKAVESPRIHLERNKLSVEKGFLEKEIAPLTALWPNHEPWGDRSLFFGGAHTVMVDHDGYTGAGDPRRGGFRLVVQ